MDSWSSSATGAAASVGTGVAAGAALAGASVTGSFGVGVLAVASNSWTCSSRVGAGLLPAGGVVVKAGNKDSRPAAGDFSSAWGPFAP